MRSVATLVGFGLLLAIHAGAETYSWTDDKGTYNLTDDLSNVPKKYRSSVRRSHESDAPMKESANQEKGSVPAVTGRSAAVEATGGSTQGGSREYEGKTLDAWRTELSQKEAELNRMRLQLEMRKNALSGPDVEERVRLTKEYNKLGEDFNQKFDEYRAAVEAVRKAFEAKESKK